MLAFQELRERLGVKVRKTYVYGRPAVFSVRGHCFMLLGIDIERMTDMLEGL